ncbi:MAG: sensor histidine kinase [Saprospiraceae bacterium]|nr:sensor histidine kinase [Saprospiraceae bacterium]
MYKNITIRQITLIITVLVTAVNIVFIKLAGSGIKTSTYIILVILLFVSTLLIVKYFLERYVFRKIKLIYKIIYDSKKDHGEREAFDFNRKSLSDVNEKVMQWATSAKKEIADLKSLEEYRKNYVGNISHELKTPIFSIQAYLHTLLDGGINDDQINIKYLKRAAENTERLQNIVEDLEIISKLESGQVEMDMRKFDLKELVKEIYMDLEPMAKEKNVKLLLKEGASQAFQVVADRESIRQVLINLVVNSIKYGRQDGTTKLSFYDMDTLILVEVSDNGIGMEEKHIKHVFDRFYRVDSSRSRKQGGSGLGLAIVKHIIEAHGQSINLRSTLNVGSTFGFTLKKAVK